MARRCLSNSSGDYHSAFIPWSVRISFDMESMMSGSLQPYCVSKILWVRRLIRQIQYFLIETFIDWCNSWAVWAKVELHYNWLHRVVRIVLKHDVHAVKCAAIILVTYSLLTWFGGLFKNSFYRQKCRLFNMVFPSEPVRTQQCGFILKLPLSYTVRHGSQK